MLLQVVLPLEAFSAYFAAECQFGTLVSPLVYHKIVALCESPLAVLAYELTLGPHLPPKLPVTVIILDVHYREHGCCYLFVRLISKTDYTQNDEQQRTASYRFFFF